jgi:Protein of unknown function (DUF551)
MTPAEREALKLAASKNPMPKGIHREGMKLIGKTGQGTHEENCTLVQGFPMGQWEMGHLLDYYELASPDVILHLLDLISSLELTLANATSLMEVQAQRIATFEASGKWISVDQELPKEETSVLIIHRGDVKIGERRWEYPTFEESYRPFWYWDDPNDDGKDWECPDVTHWQPIPAPPTEPTPEEGK